MAKRKIPSDLWDLYHMHDRILGRNACWLWPFSCNPDGYGWLRAKGFGTITAHRAFYLLVRGPIPTGFVLDHYRCDNRWCFNPWHVKPVTNKENTLRSNHSIASLNAAKTHCPKGHPLSGHNLRIDNGGRRCKLCHNRSIADTRRRRIARHRTLTQ